jgi:hypothetical protein
VARQHVRSGKVLGRPPEEWRCVGVRVDVRASVDASIVVKLRHTRRWRRCTTTWLTCSRSALTPVSILLAGLALHRNVLRWASIAILIVGLALHQHLLHRLSLAWLGFYAKLSV